MDHDAPLAFGQLYSRREIEDFYPVDRLVEANLPTIWDLSAHTDSRARRGLAALVAAHEALRTTYQVRDGVPWQRVHDDVDVPVEHVVLPDGAEPDPFATMAELASRPLPTTGALGWRGTMVHRAGRPLYLALAFSHLIVDKWAVEELEACFQALAVDPRAALPAAPRPRELAELQRGDAWATRRARAERYWAGVCAEGLPAAGTGWGAPSDRRVQLTLRSHRLGRLVSEAARTCGVTPQAVLVSAVGTALARCTGQRRPVLAAMASNRFAPELAPTVSTMNQLVPLPLDVHPAATVAEQVRGTHWAALQAMRHACYDVDRVAELVGAPARGHGGPGEPMASLFPCWFNFMFREGTGHEPPRSAVEGPAELAWDEAPRQFGWPFDVRVNGDDAHRTCIQLRVDPDLVPPDAAVDAVRTMVAGVARAAGDPATTVGAPAGPPLDASLFPGPAVLERLAAA